MLFDGLPFVDVSNWITSDFKVTLQEKALIKKLNEMLGSENNLRIFSGLNQGFTRCKICPVSCLKGVSDLQVLADVVRVI